MNKEIEELLKYIREQLMIDEEFGAKDFHKTTLNYKEVKLLLSYIEQLENNRDKTIEKLVIKQLRYLNEPKYKLTTLDLEEIKNILKGDSDDTR